MAMKFLIRYYLRTNNPNANGECSINIRASLFNERITIGATGLFIKTDLWDSKRNRAKGNKGKSAHINSELDRIDDSLMMIYRKYEFSDDLSLQTIKNEFLGRKREKKAMFTDIVDDFVERTEKEVGVSRCKASYYKFISMRKRLYKFMEINRINRKTDISEIDYGFVKDFQSFLLSQEDLNYNTATRMLSTLRTVLHDTRRRGLTENNPFADIKLRLKPVHRGYLTEEEITLMLGKKMPCRRLEQVRDMFVFMCFTGLAYIDLAAVSEEHISDFGGVKWLKIERRKTAVMSSIPLLSIPMKLIEKYRGYMADGRLFPVLSAQKLNAYLKEIGDICGIDKNLTCHLARHTFATLALTEGMSVESVSKMLGHTNIKTTMIYADIIDKKIEKEITGLADKVSKMNMTEKASEGSEQDAEKPK